MISHLHFILFVDILGNLPSYDAFLCKKTLGSNGALKVGMTASTVSLWFILTILLRLATLAYYKCIISYPPKFKA
jgi:hypothetical protein